LEIDGKSVDFGMKKAEELLALLVCKLGGSVSKSKAASMLWPDSLPKIAADSLRKVIRHLNKMMREGLALPLQITRSGLCFDISSADIDIVNFKAYSKSEAPEDWERAVDVYRGVLLSDNGFDWATEYDGEYDTVYFDLLLRLEQYFTRGGKNEKARYYRNKFKNSF
jgi:two-component SAPR family response regulator